MCEIIKICPLLTVAKGSQEGGLAKCERSNCAWYDEAAQKCSLTSLTDRLFGIENRVYALKKLT